MSKYAIQVEGLGKEYIIGGAEQRHDSFREMLTGSLMAPLRRLRKLGGTAGEEERFWALKDVSFKVEQGDVLGIIGRNGAGKSTLLKTLSRITTPSQGKVVLRGRVASLLEVGTGFHPELTGRENIFLNAAILGMGKAEASRKFQDIVEFAEIGDFADTPVKRYSSGMYVRLAFSVAAHLEPDILLIDEVLAVGDVQFQRRCLGKIEEISSTGRTVIFISHNLPSILSLCRKVLWLDGGEVRMVGEPSAVVHQYLDEATKRDPARDQNSKGGNWILRLVSLDIKVPDGKEQQEIVAGKSCCITLSIESKEHLEGLDIGIGLYDEFSRPLGLLQSSVSGRTFACSKGVNVYECVITKLPLFPGSYVLNVSITRNNELLHGQKEFGRLIVSGSKFFSTNLLPKYGPLLIESTWN